MVINISHEDKEKYKEIRKARKTRARTKRTSRISAKTRKEVFKDFEEMDQSPLNTDVEIDEHVKMNDNYMRTGPYRPKSK